MYGVGRSRKKAKHQVEAYKLDTWIGQKHAYILEEPKTEEILIEISRKAMRYEEKILKEDKEKV